ncbi:threonine--tRNA ligase [Actinomyces sp. 2119]|uniref:Threonine--tRNA ligase n=1 Tax=Actinomyces lilanjuaniae TaxID=2321394 RepID=A0ABN5PSS8_9ACTO|nr:MULTISPECIES: threonine--tRNA ligase [Actinomyces]AYD89736.1 threonine--tRNA ligase [Actinomyces lilanjuaniae]RJF44702.1 threonine--tRNA ligase [Actinomyces sp. 2119]
MPSQPTPHVIVDGVERAIGAAATGATVFEEEVRTGQVVAVRVDGEPWDLERELPEAAVVEPITLDSEDGLNILRHSATHVMAQAVQEIFPDVNLGVGPFITDGFYYDFGGIEAVTPELLREVEKRMKRIVKEGQRFVRREITEAQGRAELADQPYKLELITTKGAGAEGASVEVGSGGLTMYDNVRRDGTVAWTDLCRGPHLPSTRLIGQGFALTKFSSAYWKGDQSGDSLQRIYGTAWPSKDELKAYQHRLAEAARRDHRRLGAELDLFSFPEELGAGLPVFHPKGGVLKRVMEDYVREAHIRSGFLYVGTPHISREELFHVSGHLPYYADGMFPPMDDDGQAYYLKAMNCPMHNLIFGSRGRSYRELPLRLFEFGTVYRNEKSGVLQGLTRVRSITQDDSHSYCTPEQAPDEVRHLLTFVLTLLKDFGLDDFYLEVSTRDEDGRKKDKFIGTDEQWASATEILTTIAAECARDNDLLVVDDPGGAAFYGPKISVQAKDAIGRTWQMSTIQYDFNQPHRFGLAYTAPDGTHREPVMIHSAKFGAIERFIGVLTEHYAGAFPAWLAPVQVRLVPVAEAFNDYVDSVAARLREHGVRVEVDASDDRFGKKIRNASKEKVPFTLIAGGEDAQAGAVSFRFRDGGQTNGVPVDQAVAHIVSVITDRVNDPAGERLPRE